ncbi:unnamed protein product [Musa acuminata var. zebrina]
MRRSTAAAQRAWLPLFCVLLLLLLFSLFATAAVEDGLLNNGDFETVGAVSTGGKGDGITSFPGWTVNGTVELVESGQKQGGMILIVPQGVHAVRLGNDAEISQSLQLEKGATYAVTFSAARTCAQLETLNVSVWPASQAVDLQTLYSVEGWDAYAWAFQAPAEAEVDGAESRLSFRNPGMEDDPTCGPIIDDVAIKKLFAPERPQDDAVVNGDFEEGPWMLPNSSLGVLLPTNLDEETSALPGWMVESNRAVRYIDSYHFDVPQGKRAVELLSGKEGSSPRWWRQPLRSSTASPSRSGPLATPARRPWPSWPSRGTRRRASTTRPRATRPTNLPTSRSRRGPRGHASPSTACTTIRGATTGARSAGRWWTR